MAEEPVKELCSVLTKDEAKKAECGKVIAEFAKSDRDNEAFRKALKHLSDIVGKPESELVMAIAESEG